MENVIPENHAQLIRQMCAIPGTVELPKKITGPYWDLRICLDRVGQQPQISDLARLCVSAGYGKKTESESNPTVLQLVRTRKVILPVEVTVNWREKFVKGTLVNVSAANECTVLIDGDTRKVTADKVSLSAAA